MRGKFWIAALCILLVMGLVVVGCSNSQNTQSNETKDPEPAKETYPIKPIKVIIPNETGSSHDLAIRIMKPYLEKELSQPIVIENIAAAGGIVGTTAGWAAPADGYTIIGFSHSGHALRCVGSEDAPYKLEDFIALGGYCNEPYGVVVAGDSPWKTIEDMIADLKAKPGEYIAAGQGPIGLGGIGVVMLQDAFDVELKYMPYDGSSSSLAAALGGHADFAVVPASRYADRHEAGELRILLSLNDEETPELKGIPTIVEKTGQDFVVNSIRGHMVHKDTPPEVVKALKEVYAKVISDPEVKAEINKEVPYALVAGEKIDAQWNNLGKQISKYVPELEVLNK